MITNARLQQLTSAFPQQRIAVVGDFFLDKYLDTDPAQVEPSVETGKPAHQVVAVRCSAGAAGTVVNNLAALGAGALHAVGLTGDDGERYELCRCLESLGCSTQRLLKFPQLMTPTYLKPRDVNDASLSGEHSRYDTKNRRPTPPEVSAAVIDALDAVLPQVDAVIVLDQVVEEGCGVITLAVAQAIAERATRHPELIFWVDSRASIRRFRHVITKPNQFEAVGRLNPGPRDRVALGEIESVLPSLRAATGAPVCVTLGEQGMLVSDPVPTLVPGVRVDGAIDVTGAGDSATAGAVLALAAGAVLPEAALVGNLVASITIQQLATTGTARPDQLPARLELWRRQHASR